MTGNKLLLFIVAMIGIVTWNMPSTVSIFYGTHTFYDGGPPCTKCHNVEIATHTGTMAHNNFTCGSCHRSEPSIVYNSKNTTGIEAHASSKGSCENCHNLSMLIDLNVTA